MKAIVAVIVVACVLAAAPRSSTTSTVTSSCRASTDTSTMMVQKIQAIVTSFDSTNLAGVGLLPAQSSDVNLVTADSLCALGLTAFNTARVDSLVTPASSIYLVKVGSQRFVAFEPGFASGEFYDLLIFNTSFALLGWLDG